MIPQEQQETFAFLARPETFGGKAVAQVHTHISAVFLAGDEVFKLKRAVNLGFVDFSTLEKRKAACEKEVLVNSVAAPELYLGVRPITREPSGALKINGTGEPVDWLVVMRRFDEETLFDRLAAHGKLDRDEMLDLGRAVARFHEKAEPDKARGGAAAMKGTIEGNRDSFSRYVPAVFSQDQIDRLTANTMAELDQVAPLLDARREAGRVRRCHGDLHLRNICLTNGQPTLFDAIEFNDDFAVIDVLYDMAFLVMDLDSRDLRRLANIAFNHYLPHTDDMDGLPAMPLFLSCRAAIRSHVAAAMAEAQEDEEAARNLRAEAHAYFARAEEYLQHGPPKLVAVGGLSGSGKSRMGRELAPYFRPAPGAVVLRTDVIRKRLLNWEVEEKLPVAAYGPEMSQRTYAALFQQARRALATGYPVIADAVFSKEEERRAIEQVAQDCGVPFHGLWLEAPPGVMAERITTRQRNASDATEAVLKKQMDYDLGEIIWERIDSSGDRDVTIAKGREIVRV